MDQNLLRSYFGTVYEFPSPEGTVRVSLDGEIVRDVAELPPVLRGSFAVITAYNPRSMLLPRKVNEQRHQVMRDLLILGCYRVEACVGYDEDPDASWREPAWLVHAMDREEAIDFGRSFRQNTVIYANAGKAELIVTDPTCDELGRAYQTHFRVRQ